VGCHRATERQRARGGYFLVQTRAGTGIASLPTPDLTVNTIDMSGTNGKIALVLGTTSMTGACPLANTLDFAGYGTANCFEGTAAVAVLSTTTAAFRGNAGCTDLNVNSTDFTVATPRRATRATRGEHLLRARERDRQGRGARVLQPAVPRHHVADDGPDHGRRSTRRSTRRGITERRATAARVTMQLGYGASGLRPAHHRVGRRGSARATATQSGNNDEYLAAFIAPAAGTYSYNVARDARPARTGRTATSTARARTRACRSTRRSSAS